MSGDSPVVAGGSVRQRHSLGDGGDAQDLAIDLEDDASSSSGSPRSMPSFRRVRSWSEVLFNLIWLVSAGFVIYHGDGRASLVLILWSDGRIKRTVFYVGLVTIVLNLGVVLYATLLSWGPHRSDEKDEAFLSTAPFVTMLGSISFCLISFALWPVWGFLTILLSITLFMSSVVILSYLINEPFRPEVIRDE